MQRAVHSRFNRKLDGESGRAEGAIRQTIRSGTGVQRQYLLEIRNQSACTELGANGYLPAATTWTMPCVITGGVNPRIRMGALFGKGAKFPVDFLTTNPALDKSVAISYESTHRLSNATVVAGPGDLTNVRTVSYTGNVKLVKFSPFGEKPRTVAEPFALPFHMTFVRTAR